MTFVGVDPQQVADFTAFSAAARLMGVGRLEEATEIALDLLNRYPDPAHPEAAYIVGLATWWLKYDGPRAEELLAHVVKHRPRVAEYWYNLGYVRQRQGKTLEAVSAYERALAIHPQMAGAHVNLGNAKLAAGNVQGALTSYGAAMASGEQHALARYNRAIAFLLTGHWKEGWADLECRWQSPEFLARVAVPPYPSWDGTPPKPGQRLLVFAEQGLGDTVMCWRYHERLTEIWGADRVIWCVQPELVPILPGSVPMQGEWPEADFVLPAMSCMDRLGMQAGGAPYLSKGTPRAADPVPRRIGYVWAGSTTHENDRLRSIPRDLLNPLLMLPGIEWVELQVGRGGTYQPKDWVETCERLLTLDLLITVDTCIAHVAGAMGVPTWMLLHTPPDYRWGYQGDTTLWYDALRLWRQTHQGDWVGVVERMSRVLSGSLRRRDTPD